jgi:hypothetical protein
MRHEDLSELACFGEVLLPVRLGAQLYVSRCVSAVVSPGRMKSCGVAPRTSGPPAGA